MLRLLLVGILLAVAPPALAEIYTWTDADGVRHYSNVEVRGRALPETAFDAEAHRKRLAREAAWREMEMRAEALAAECAALLCAMQPPPPAPAPVTVVRNTVVLRTVVSRPYPAYDRYRAALRRPVQRRVLCRPRPHMEKHVPYYKRHLVVPKIR